jgi:hypothetical protein
MSPCSVIKRQQDRLQQIFPDGHGRSSLIKRQLFEKQRSMNFISIYPEWINTINPYEWTIALREEIIEKTGL